MISPEDLELFQYADEPAAALGILQGGVAAEVEPMAPDFAGSRCEIR